MPDLQLDTEDNKLSITQTFSATASRLFACFTQADLLNQWHAPSDTMAISAEVDLKIGGRYRIAMTELEGKTHTAVGICKEIDEPRKLVYSWRWEGSEDPDTLVTVEFKQDGQQTEVTLTHENFPNSEVTTHHSQGWSGIYRRLAGFC